jgi:hypothetical protein
VVAHDLVRAVEPVGEPFVQGRAALLRRRARHRFLDQHVPEPERRFAARADEASCGEGPQVPLRRRGRLGFEQRHELGVTERTADDRRPLEDGALTRAEPVEARREQRTDRCRQRPLRPEPLLGRERYELLDE